MQPPFWIGEKNLLEVFEYLIIYDLNNLLKIHELERRVQVWKKLIDIQQDLFIDLIENNSSNITRINEKYE